MTYDQWKQMEPEYPERHDFEEIHHCIQCGTEEMEEENQTCQSCVTYNISEIIDDLRDVEIKMYNAKVRYDYEVQLDSEREALAKLEEVKELIESKKNNYKNS